LTPTTTSFFTAPADGTLTFVYEGYSADDTDHMVFALNTDALFTNKTTAVGSAVDETVVAGQVYQLSLHDDHTGDTWSSDPAFNWDGLVHLASTGVFSDFHLGTTAPKPVTTNCAIAGSCYLGWEDRPPGADEDFNDLVFAVQFTPTSPRSGRAGDPVPEPSALTLLFAGLVGLGFVARQCGRRRRVGVCAAPASPG
jgi:hypothetical protein